MKRAILIVALLLLWAPGTALADYDARKREVLEVLERAAVTDQERTTLRAALDRYFPSREDCLDALVGIVSKPDKGEQEPMFLARSLMCQSGASQALGDAIDDIDDPTVAALGFVTLLATEEAAFYQSLSAITVADARDQIVMVRSNLADMTNALDKKWETILNEDKSLDERAKKMADDIRSDYDAVVRAAADAHPEAKEAISEWVKKYAENEASPDIPTPSATLDALLAALKYAVVPLIETWQSTNTRSEARVRAYKATFASEIRILIMFKDVRKEVREFLATNDWPRAEAAHAQARSSLDSFVSSAKTSGQSSDASELRRNLLEKLAIHLRDGADVYASFVGKHQGRFFGVLGPDVKEALVEHHEWERNASILNGYGLDTKLRAWHESTTNFFHADLSRLPSKVRDEVKVLLRAIIEQLIKEQDTARKAHEAVQSLVEEEREDVEDVLD